MQLAQIAKAVAQMDSAEAFERCATYTLSAADANSIIDYDDFRFPMDGGDA